LIDCLGFKRSNVRRLAALPKQLERGRAFRRFDQSFRDKALACCEKFPALLDRPASSAHWEALLSVDQIDAGEALLFAKLAEGNASLLATGDQRSLIALGNADQLRLFRNEIRGRVICLESALLRLVNSLGADVVGKAFQPLRGVDTKIDIFFGHKIEFMREEVVRQLSSYLNDLRVRLGDDFLGDSLAFGE
jgi:hypothetical protein